ncbi:MAG: hypothetical protein H6814_00615 [Phycisphaeraceae bacterium]|nr:hypothetical protein [Phycisphaeraceae bacterium]
MLVKRVVAIASLLALNGQALAQDSVALVPGGNDALSAYDAQLVRYAVDLVPFSSSWGSEFVVGPVLKASRSLDGGYRTQKPFGAVLSADVDEHVSVPSQPYATWSARGAGVHPSENSAPGSINMSYFNRRVGIALTDLGFGPTNVIGALAGWREVEPDRLYVERRVALSSRSGAASPDHSSLSLGSIDAAGEVTVRADDFGIPDQFSNRIQDENIVRVDTKLRDASPNALHNTIGVNISDDPASTLFFVNKSTVSLATPTAMPSSVSGAGESAPITLDFLGAHRIGGGPLLFDHLDPLIEAHRGAPSYSTVSFNSGDSGSFAYLAVTEAGVSLKADAVVAATIDSNGQVVGTISATIPFTVTSGPFVADNPEFVGHLSQSTFRGGSGPVAIGTDSAGDIYLAATAHSDADQDFIAVARFAMPIGGSAATWLVAAHPGKPVLDGPGGQQIGTIVDGSLIGSPVSLSSPAMDLLGNVYFVAAYKPTLGPARTAVIKAVNTGSGYELEKLLETGQIIVGANSTRPYEIHSIALGDADSIASGSIWSSSILQQRRIGAGGSAALPDAMGALVVSAVIEYDNMAQLEQYDAVLFIAPKGLDGLVGDINGDGIVDTADLGVLLGAFGGSDPMADLNGDGVVDTADLGLLLSRFGDTA